MSQKKKPYLAARLFLYVLNHRSARKHRFQLFSMDAGYEFEARKLGKSERFLAKSNETKVDIRIRNSSIPA